jgi:hypothetical protein
MTRGMSANEILSEWHGGQQRIARSIIEKYGQPDEAIPSQLIWHKNGPWKRTIIHREAAHHNFPMQHGDFVEQIIDYHVPIDRLCDIARFDGSVIVLRTLGEMSARCRDEQANSSLSTLPTISSSESSQWGMPGTTTSRV